VVVQADALNAALPTLLAPGVVGRLRPQTLAALDVVLRLVLDLE
jgi:hypothetical protein